MKVIFTKARILSLNIVDNGFIGFIMNSTKYAFEITRLPEKNKFAYQIISHTDIDCHNGDSIEFICEVTYIYDDYGKRPLFMLYLDLAEEAVPMMNKLFNEEVAPKLPILIKDMVHPFTDVQVSELIQGQMNKIYPIK